MDSAVEKVARALGEHLDTGALECFSTEPAPPQEWSDEAGDFISRPGLVMRYDGEIDLIALARAAIEALREPSPEMVEAANEGVLSQSLSDMWPMICKNVYSAMVTAALDPAPTTPSQPPPQPT